MPETTFTFRVDQELKKAFPETVRANDRPDSQLLRDFMRDYVERAAHDAWFRAEVEQSLKEADDPNAELTPKAVLGFDPPAQAQMDPGDSVTDRLRSPLNVLAPRGSRARLFQGSPAC